MVTKFDQFEDRIKFEINKNDSKFENNFKKIEYSWYFRVEEDPFEKTQNPVWSPKFHHL